MIDYNMLKLAMAIGFWTIIIAWTWTLLSCFLFLYRRLSGGDTRLFVSVGVAIFCAFIVGIIVGNSL